jgi:hypothetical protein
MAQNGSHQYNGDEGMTTIEKRTIAPDTVAHIQDNGDGKIWVAILKTYYWGLHDEPETDVIMAQAFKTMRGVEGYIQRYLGYLTPKEAA